MNSKEVIIEFLKEMTEWEISFDQKRRLPAYRAGEGIFIDSVKNEYRTQCKLILEKYLTPPLFTSLGLASLSALMTGTPPIHTQSIEPHFEEQLAKSVIFVTQGTGSMSFPHGRYTLKKINEKWLIDQFHNSWDGVKWTKAKSI